MSSSLFVNSVEVKIPYLSLIVHPGLITPTKDETIKIAMDQVIPVIKDPETTKYIKHVKIESKLLSEFWGRPVK